MNLHMPQDVESDSELLNLAAVPYNIISPANNAPIIGIFQDSMLGSYLFTKSNVNFTKAQAMDLLMSVNNVNINIFNDTTGVVQIWLGNVLYNLVSRLPYLFFDFLETAFVFSTI